MHRTQKTRKTAALLSLIFGLTYSIAQILTLLNWIPAPYDLIAMFIPSLLLAPCFLVTMASLHYSHSNESKNFGLIAVCFALLYCGFVSLVYFSQLASVIPAQLRGEPVSNMLLFKGQGIMVAVDALGYGFMSVATFFASRAFTMQRGLHRSMMAHSLMAPVIISSFFFPSVLAVGALWMVTFPWAMIEVMRFCNGQAVAGHRTSTRISRRPEPVLEN